MFKALHNATKLLGLRVRGRTGLSVGTAIMVEALAGVQMLSVPTKDGAKVNLVHLAGYGSTVVLVLPANGFHIRCYIPLAQQLATAESEFQCWGVEFRGQGSEPAPPGSLLDLYYDDLLNVVHTVSLQGCLAFTHSGGAQIALAVETQNPGTFAAIYAFEPVLWPVKSPSSHTSDDQHLIQGYLALAAFAKRRKSHFHSRKDAARRFRARPPFSAFHPTCFQHYVDHGLTEQDDGTCILSISTELEARCYLDAGSAAMTPKSNSYRPLGVQCPVTIGVGNSKEGLVTFLAQEGIKQATHFPQGRLERFEGLTHLGPLEDPARVAARALHFYQASKNESTWATLPFSQIIPLQHQAKL